MKKVPNIILGRFGLVILATLAAAQGTAWSQVVPWDINGSTAGAGGSAPSGLWDLASANWNNAAGDGMATTWGNTGAQTAVFAAGTDATGAYSVTLGAGAPLKVAGITVNLGTVSLVPQTVGDGLDFGTTPAALNVAAGATLNVGVGILGTAGVIKSGSGTAVLSAGTQATGAYVVQGGELQIANGVSVNATTLTLGGAAGLATTLTLGATAVLNLGDNVTFSNVNTPLAGLVQGGTLTLNGARTITVQNITGDPDLTIQSVIADGTTTSNLTKTGGGLLLLSGANTYTGTTTVSGTTPGALAVQGNNASIASSSALNVGGGAVVTLGGTTDTVAVNRVGDSAAITLTGTAAGVATLNYIGANFASQAVHAETAGVLTFAGNQRSIVSLTPGAGDEVALQFASLVRSDLAVGLVRGAGLGAVAGTADSTRVYFTTAPTLTGGILPWLLGDTSTANAGTGFLTYDAAVGLRFLTAGEYTAPGAASTGSNVLKSATGAQAFNTSQVVNSWTTSATGTTTLGANVTLGISSGAMLFTATNTIAGGTLNLASVNEGILHITGTAAVTTTINSVITGTLGFTLNGAGTGNKILVLGGANTITGGVRVYGGILQLNNAGALNASGANALTMQGGTLRVNGQQVTVAGLAGDGAVQNFHASVGAVLRVNGGGTFSGVLSNGTGAALGLTKTGNATLSLQANNTYTDATLVEQGVLQLGAGAGRVSGTTSITVRQGATLRLSNTNANNNNADRVNDSAAITLAGGILDFNNSAAAGIDYSETLGSVTLGAGASQITADQAAAATDTAAARVSTLSLGGLSRQTGGTVNFVGGASGLGQSTRNRLDVGGLTAGFIGGWATVGAEFAKYVADIDGATAGNQGSVAAFTAADYSSLTQADWTSAQHVKPTADQTLDASRNVASVNLTLGMDLNLGGNGLNIASGGLIKQGGAVANNGAANRSQITNGSLTAGVVANAELLVRVTGANLNITAAITDNAGGAVHVVKSGAGTLFLGGANTYTGSTYVNEGVLTVGSGGDGSSAAQAGATGRTGTGTTFLTGTAVLTGSGVLQGALVMNGGTLRPGDSAGDTRSTLWVGGSFTLNSGNISLQVANPTLNVTALSNSGDAGYAAALAGLASNAALAAPISTGQHDHVEVSGTFDWGTGLGLVTVLNTGYTPVAGDVFNLLDWASVTNAGNVDVAQDLALFDLSTSGLGWDTSLWASHGVLVVTQVPEPSRALLLLGGMVTLGLRRRKA